MCFCFKMLIDLFLNLYEIFLIQGLNYLPQGLVKQQKFVFLQAILARLDIECCLVFGFLLFIHWNIQDFLSSNDEHYT